MKGKYYIPKKGIKTYFGFGEVTPNVIFKWGGVQISEVLGVVTTGVVNISSFGAESPDNWCSEVVEATNEVGLKVLLELWLKWDPESGPNNFGVVSISSDEVEDRLLSVSLFLEAMEAIEAADDPPRSRPVILLAANISQHTHFEAL